MFSTYMMFLLGYTYEKNSDGTVSEYYQDPNQKNSTSSQSWYDMDNLSPSDMKLLLDLATQEFKEEYQNITPEVTITYGNAENTENKNINVTINGKSIPYDDNYGYPYIDQNNRTMVPLRITLESAGAQVDYDSTTSTAIITYSNVKLEVPIGTDYILRNSVKVQNDTKSVINNGRTYLPIRIIFESLGYTVDWIGDTRTIDIYNYNYLLEEPIKQQRIYDKADLLTDEEENSILNSFQSFADKYNVDIAFLSILENGLGDAWNYAHDFYHANNLGLGENKDGILLLIDMDTRMIQVYTNGIVQGYIPDEFASKIADDIFNHIYESYFESVKTFISSTSKYMDAKVNYDEEQGVNGPVLENGMVPVKIVNNAWVVCDSNDKDWYNYDLNIDQELRYAGAILVNDTASIPSVGTPISLETTVYVWLPRYSRNEDGSQLFHSMIFLDWVDDELYVPEAFMNENYEPISGFWVEEQ